MCVLHHHTDGELNTSTSTEYLLACGKGIKNVHLFSYYPHNPHCCDAGGDSSAGAALQCMYDISSNGNTIESMCFRVTPDPCRDGYYHCRDPAAPTAGDPSKPSLLLYSKSSGANIRVWDLSSRYTVSPGALELPGAGGRGAPVQDSVPSDTDTDAADTGSPDPLDPAALPLSKCAYEDLPNTQDIRYLFNQNYCYGGTYEFAVLQLESAAVSGPGNTAPGSASDPSGPADAPGSAGSGVAAVPKSIHCFKSTLALPEPSCSSDAVSSRRMMRQIHSMIGTRDGMSVLLLCSDGAIMHYALESEGGSGGGSSSTANGLTVLDEGGAGTALPAELNSWTMKRLGPDPAGRILTARVLKGPGSTTIQVRLLAGNELAEGLIVYVSISLHTCP